VSEFVVVGLGNPGPQYVLTRHNIGFLFLDKFIERYPPIGTVKKREYVSYVVLAEGMKFRLIRPLTFMNLSGRIFDGLKVAEPPLLVHDDLDLPLGRIRIRENGSSGGHKGVKSIMSALKTMEIPRIRVGIGPKTSDAVDFVLSEFSNEELKIVYEIVDVCVDATIVSAKDGVKIAMNRFNSMKVI